MTITSTPSEVTYAGDDVSVAFPIPFVFDTSADLKVIQTDSDGNPVVLSSGFSIAGGAGSTGTLTLTTALPSGESLTILDDPERSQSIDYIANDVFPAESAESGFDRTTRLAKRNYQRSLKAMRVADGDPSAGVGMQLGSVNNRKGKYLFFNAVTGALEYAAAVADETLSKSVIFGFIQDQTPAEILAGKTPTNLEYGESCPNRYKTNAVPDTTDMTIPIQDAIEVWENGGREPWFQNEAYKTTSAVKHLVGHDFAMHLNGATITNSTAGNTVELGDDITQYNDAKINGGTINNSVTGGACVYARKRPNTRIYKCTMSDGGADTTSYVIRIEESWGSTISQCTLACRGTAVHISDQSHGVSLVNTRMDGNPAFSAIGVVIDGAGHSITGCIIESMYGCGILAVGCKGLKLKCYFENNAVNGLVFTGDARTIKADVIFNGGLGQVISAASPSIGVSMEGCYFQPPAADDIDCSVYLIATKSFSEKGNTVNQAYNSAAAFIKTKNDSAFYQNTKLELGNSHVEGANDVYFDIESLNDAANTSYHEETLRSIYIPPSQIRRFDAHDDSAHNPETYIVHSASAATLAAANNAAIKYKGLPTYDITRSGAGSSDTVGETIAEADYEDFWDSELWFYTIDVKAVTNLPGFELWINDGATWFASGGGTALTTAWTQRTIVFKPAAGSDVLFGYRMTGGTGADVVRISKPIICPLGALGDLGRIMASGDLGVYTRAATIVEDRDLLASASATATNNNNVIAALIADLQAKGHIG